MCEQSQEIHFIEHIGSTQNLTSEERMEEDKNHESPINGLNGWLHGFHEFCIHSNFSLWIGITTEITNTRRGFQSKVL